MNRKSLLVVFTVLNLVISTSAYLVAQTDEFPGQRSVVVDGPANDATEITPGTSVLTDMTRAIYVGTGGAMTVRTRGGNDITFSNIPDGSIIPIRADKIYSAGTDASDIVSLHD